MHLFIACNDADTHLYEAAVYFEEEDRFKHEEVQKIADDFAINLPESWLMEMSFVDALPAEAIAIPGTEAALFIQTKKRSVQKTATAYIRPLNGETEKQEYTITSTSGRVTIGREKRVMAEDGFFRINHIAFPDASSNESNKYVSRQHAHIEFDQESGCFVLYADEGGVPPKNKIKIRSVKHRDPIKLNTTKIGHHLEEGDQIMLGESALLEFSFHSEEK
jgi:hypothetical protein